MYVAAWVENPVFWLIRICPVKLRNLILVWFVWVVVQVHKICRLRTGLHQSLSWEMHALSTMMWPMRLMRLNWAHCRFALTTGIESNFPALPGFDIETTTCGYYVTHKVTACSPRHSSSLESAFLGSA